MLHKYRKTALIEAERFDGSDEMMKKYHINNRAWIGRVIGPADFRLPTKEGLMEVKIDDWIATGIDGEHWAIAPDIFERTYERVD
ncbi:hypothetical protein HHK02_00200 [Limosilactobacillus reuteri]|uniref:Phage protein n=1 Tax=Limosilactobacillus reuteri TaxID=1598 RepID=A0A7L6BI19_LIMRT|nr:hypothetical protein [Limosilactobacillus reuteri]QLQ61795.1 hypothetical protein HHK02_00200 [Limosilactobacillus reuteri]